MRIPVVLLGLVLVAACSHDGGSTPKVCAGAVAEHSLDVDDLCTADAQCRWPVCHQGYCAAQCDYESAPDYSFECSSSTVKATCAERVVEGMSYIGCAYTCAKSEDCPELADAALSCIDGLCVAPSCEALGE